VIAGSCGYIEERVRGRLWIKRPIVFLGGDMNEFLVACPANSSMVFPADFDRDDGAVETWTAGQWKLTSKTFKPPTVFRIMSCDRPYDVWFCTDDRNFLGCDWYVNFQRPCVLRGEVVETMDWQLDLKVDEASRSWQLKDQSEFDAALASGLLTSEDATQVEQALSAVQHAIEDGALPWDPAWRQFASEAL